MLYVYSGKCFMPTYVLLGISALDTPPCENSIKPVIIILLVKILFNEFNINLYYYITGPFIRDCEADPNPF
jgi:hypothetical protein